MRGVPTGCWFALAITSVLACATDNNNEIDFRDDVINCEDALDRLTSCCPNFDGRPIVCRHVRHHDNSCGLDTYDTEDPALNSNESSCIQSKSCAELQSQGICAKAQTQARAYTSHSATGTDILNDPTNDHSGTTHSPVCP
jgi:hypothetical protein